MTWCASPRSENDGGIFGLLGSSAPILGIASLGVIAVIVWVQARQGVHSLLLTIALGLLLGGAVGNLLDRVRYGHVVDWVDTGIGNARFYTFNVADSAISIAVLLLLGIGLAGAEAGRPRAARASAASGVDGPAAQGWSPVSTVVRVEVPASGSAGRADRFVADASGISRAQVQRLISDGRVTRDGVRMRARDVLAPGSVVELDVPDPVPAAAAPEHIPLEIVYEDDDCSSWTSPRAS